MSFRKKISSLSKELRQKIIIGERQYRPTPETPVTNWLVHTKRHCNGGKIINAGLWLKQHTDNGGKIFLALAGAGSTFQVGIVISELIRAGKIAAISATGANLEESLYRLVANSYYARIPNYDELTRSEEKELAQIELCRITDTFIPEEESVRVIFPELEKLWREAEINKRYLLWHEYFFQLFERKMIKFDPTANVDDCWLYQAYLHKVPVFVPGAEDSTMGNLFSYISYNGNHPVLSKYKPKQPISQAIICNSFSYMHRLAEWYLDNTEERGLAFLQLGGGIASDFPICVVPHIKADFLWDQQKKIREKMVRAWAGFIEIYSSPMSFGSYSGAGFKEKITWEKLDVDTFGEQIFGDYTAHFPDIAAIILGK